MTVFRPKVLLPVEAQGMLRLDAPTGRPMDVVADGDTLRVDVPGWREIRALAPRSSRARARAIRLLAAILSSYGLTLSMESAGRPVIQLGCNVRPTILARLLGLAPARIPVSAISLLFRP